VLCGARPDVVGAGHRCYVVDGCLSETVPYGVWRAPLVDAGLRNYAVDGGAVLVDARPRDDVGDGCLLPVDAGSRDAVVDGHGGLRPALWTALLPPRPRDHRSQVAAARGSSGWGVSGMVGRSARGIRALLAPRHRVASVVFGAADRNLQACAVASDLRASSCGLFVASSVECAGRPA